MTNIRVLALAAAVGAGCSSPSTQPAPPTAPPPAAAAAAPDRPSAAAQPSGTLTLLEPADGSFAGHVGLFKWSAVSGADGYRIAISTGSGRLVWESPVMTETEAHPPNTVALEPEPHTWVVTALKGTDPVATSPIFRFTITP